MAWGIRPRAGLTVGENRFSAVVEGPGTKKQLHPKL